MDSDANSSAVRIGAVDGRRGRITRALRLAPPLAALTIWCAFIGACGRSIYSTAGNSPTPTATITTSPTTGNFLYSSNFGDGKVAEFKRNLTTGSLALIGSVGAGSANGPMGIANGPSAKYLYVTNSADGNVRQFKINSTTGALTAITGTPVVAAGSSPQWIAVTPNAQFAFATNSGDGTISQYTVNTTTGALTANGTAFSSMLLSAPAAAVASNNWLYVTDATKGTIVSFPIGLTGTLSVGTKTTLSGTAVPGPVIMDPSGQFVYATDQNAGLVYYFTVGTGVLTLAASPYTSSTKGEGGLAIGTTTLGNKFLFVANQLESPPSISVFFVNGDGSLGPPVQFVAASLPTGLIVDPTGSFLYVANQGNGTISPFAINTTTGALGPGVPVATESPATSKPLYLSLGQ
jgi:6-phosphogluconolactonase